MVVPPPPPPPTAYADDTYIRMTPDEWRDAARGALKKLGISYSQLKQEAERDDFSSTRARKLWLLIRGTF